MDVSIRDVMRTSMNKEGLTEAAINIIDKEKTNKSIGRKINVQAFQATNYRNLKMDVLNRHNYEILRDKQMIF